MTTDPQETVIDATVDPRVAAIRNDPSFGEGSCSAIDECYDDDELALRLDAMAKTTVASALAWARMAHDIWVDRMDDAHNASF